MPESKLKTAIFVAIEFLVAALVAYVLISSSIDFDRKKPIAKATIWDVPTPATTTFPLAKKVEIITEPFKNLQLGAKAAIVYDINENKILFSKAKDDMLPIASITKLMTAFTASRLLDNDSVITVTEEDASLQSSAGIIAGEQWKMKDLMAFTLVTSSNGGAKALAREAELNSNTAFVAEMNNLAKSIGLESTLFRNETGLDLFNEQVSGSYSTAYDVAKLYSYIIRNRPEILKDTNKALISKFTLNNVRHEGQNTNTLVSKIPNLISSKTGTTNLAGGNLAIAFRAAGTHPVVIVVLGSTPQSRYSDIEKLVRDTTGHFSKKGL